MTDSTSADYINMDTGSIIPTKTQFIVCVQLGNFGIAQNGQCYNTLVVFNKDYSLHEELSRESGQEELYDKLDTDIRQQGFQGYMSH